MEKQPYKKKKKSAIVLIDFCSNYILSEAKKKDKKKQLSFLRIITL